MSCLQSPRVTGEGVSGARVRRPPAPLGAATTWVLGSRVPSATSPVGPCSLPLRGHHSQQIKPTPMTSFLLDPRCKDPVSKWSHQEEPCAFLEGHRSTPSGRLQLGGYGRLRSAGLSHSCDLPLWGDSFPYCSAFTKSLASIRR